MPRELNPYIADITSIVFINATMFYFSIGELLLRPTTIFRVLLRSCFSSCAV